MKPVLTLTLEVAAGVDIDNAAYSAIAIAFKLNCIVSFTFNGVKCLVGETDNVSEIRDKYFAELRIQNGTK